MPSKKPSTKKVRKTSVKKQTSRNNFVSKLLARKTAILIILGIALVGVFVLSRSNAATTNFEAEAASLSGGAKVISNSTSQVSAGKYVQLTSNTTQQASIQRFPGDPNPKVTGKAYWGAAIDGNADPVYHEAPAGKSLSVRRTYWDWGKLDKMVSTAKSDIQANRLPFVSTKTPGWAEMSSGRRDAEIDAMLRKLDAVGGPVWLTVHHEPEGGCRDNCKGPKGEDDVAGSAGWLAMQKKIRERMNAVGTKNIAFVANLMTWTWDSRSGRNPNDWWADNVWDVYTANSYCDDAKGKCDNGGETAVSIGMWKNFEEFAISKSIPYGAAEWGDRGSEAGAGTDIQKVWNHGFSKNSDLVVWAYFDSDLNSPTGGWSLQGSALDAFRNILKNDNRVQRVSELGKDTPVAISRGSMNSPINIPASGNYRVWVRMNAPSKDSSVQVQVDNGIVQKVGGDLDPNAWTWVGWKDGNRNSPSTMSLESGNRAFGLTSTDPNVKIDRVMVTDENCVPQALGDNCVVIMPPTDVGGSTGSANVQISSPVADSTVKGLVNVAVAPTDNIQEVSFRINDKWQATDKDAPFEWVWDTTQYSEGQTSVTIRARKVGDPGSVYTERSINVNVGNVTPPSVPNPPASQVDVSITKPTNGQTITGTTVVGVNANKDLEEVSFRVNDKWQATDKDAPFEWVWDTAKYPNGATTVTIRARAKGDAGDSYIEKSVNVQVKNSNQQTADTVAPTAPGNLRANTQFDWGSTSYAMNLGWSPSVDNADVQNYVVMRNGKLLGEPSNATFKDINNLEANVPYKYEVIARDTSGNKSEASSITVSGSCWFVWCSTKVL